MSEAKQFSQECSLIYVPRQVAFLLWAPFPSTELDRQAHLIHRLINIAIQLNTH